MAEISYKSGLTLIVLDILKKYADEEHPLSQKAIVDICCRDYCAVDRKAIARRLHYLLTYGEELGYPVRCVDTARAMTLANQNTGIVKTIDTSIHTNYYLENNSEFDDAELRLLIDSVLFDDHIPHKQRMDLIAKLKGLTGSRFERTTHHANTYCDRRVGNPQFFYTIEVLTEAIKTGRQVVFAYLEYGTDHQWHKRLSPSGDVREYRINPYQLVVREGKYYLICNYDKYNDISNYRVDRISDIRMLATPVKPFETLDGAEKGRLDLSRYMGQHVFMFSSDTITAQFRIKKQMMSDVIDLFGADVTFFEETDRDVGVTVQAVEAALYHFVKIFSPDVRVLWPERLVEKVKADIKQTLSLYEGAEEYE